MVDLTIKGANSTPEITVEVAGQVYDLIVEHGNADSAYKNKGDSSIEPEHFLIVDKEIDRLFNDFNKYAYGKVVLVEEEGHYDEETMEYVVDVPEEVYVKTTETDFKAQFTSELLDTDAVYSLWKGSKTWTEIKTPSEE